MNCTLVATGQFPGTQEAFWCRLNYSPVQNAFQAQGYVPPNAPNLQVSETGTAVVTAQDGGVVVHVPGKWNGEDVLVELTATPGATLFKAVLGVKVFTDPTTPLFQGANLGPGAGGGFCFLSLTP